MTLSGADRRASFPKLHLALSSSASEGATGSVEYTWWIDEQPHAMWTTSSDVTVDNRYLFLQGKHVLNRTPPGWSRAPRVRGFDARCSPVPGRRHRPCGVADSRGLGGAAKRLRLCKRLIRTSRAVPGVDRRQHDLPMERLAAARVHRTLHHRRIRRRAGGH